MVVLQIGDVIDHTTTTALSKAAIAFSFGECQLTGAETPHLTFYYAIVIIYLIYPPVVGIHRVEIVQRVRLRALGQRGHLRQLCLVVNTQIETVLFYIITGCCPFQFNRTGITVEVHIARVGMGLFGLRADIDGVQFKTVQHGHIVIGSLTFVGRTGIVSRGSECHLHHVAVVGNLEGNGSDTYVGSNSHANGGRDG